MTCVAYPKVNTEIGDLSIYTFLCKVVAVFHVLL